MGRMSRILHFGVLFVWAYWSTAGIAADERFEAWLADGQRLTAEELPSWPLPGVPGRFSGEDLFADRNPVRLMVDTLRAGAATRARKSACLVFANGDVLPGMPVGIDQEPILPPGRMPRVRVAVEPPLVPLHGAELLVRAERIRRLASAERIAVAEPPAGTVLSADGRQWQARAIRWRDGGLSILTEEGVVDAAFADLADVVFPGVEIVPAVLEDNLYCGDAPGMAIVRIQATNGAVVTTARFRREQVQDTRRVRGNEGVMVTMQPAWSHQPLALPGLEMVCCGYRAANEMPLASLPVSEVFGRRAIGRGSLWSTNRPGIGALLATREQRADMGVTTWSETAVAFSLPPQARSLALSVGMEQTMGDGGCVRCKIVAGQTLWDSGIFQGKDQTQHSGVLDVRGQETVQLVTEFAHDQRPAGADPFDIRDQVAWLHPLVTLDLGPSAGDRAASMLAGLREWKVEQGEWSEFGLTSQWSEPGEQWDAVVSLPKERELVLSRRLRVVRGGDVLELLTVSPTDLNEHEFELTVDGEVVKWRNNADRNQLRQWMLRYARTRSRERSEETNLTERLAYWWDLSPWRGREIDLRLRLRGKNEQNAIAWRNLAMRSAIANLPVGEEPRRPDLRLTALDPLRGDHGNRGARKASDEPILLLGQTFEDGISLARDTRVTYSVPPEGQSFVAIVGCTTQVAGPVQVLIDDRVMWERAAINSLHGAEQIALAIPKGAKTLTLVNGADGLFYGVVAFAEAGFVSEAPRN